MKILLINEYDKFGGTEVQTKREYDMWREKGACVYCIFIRKNSDLYKNDPYVFYYHKKIGKLKNIVGKFITDEKLYWFIRNKIDEINPDIIHINNVFYSPYAIYKAVGNRKCIQTLRDYKAVCPKSTACYDNWEICEQTIGINCIKCAIFSKGVKRKIKILGQYFSLLRVRKYRKKYVDKFITPSIKLKDYCNKARMDAICIANSFDLSLVKNFKKITESTKVFLYYGNIVEHKGIKQLIEAFQLFSHDKDTELHIVGACAKEMKSWIQQYADDDKIKIFDYMDHNKILKKLQSVYAVVVPSLWMENYPNTVLEGFATECIVLVSNRGGMVEQIQDDKRIFDVLDREDIINKLNYVFYLPEKEREDILKSQMQYLFQHNDPENYYVNLLKCIGQI